MYSNVYTFLIILSKIAIKFFAIKNLLRINKLLPSGHCALFGYLHIPLPLDSLHIVLVKAIVLLHDSGQQRLTSLLQESQYLIEFEQLYPLQPEELLRQASLSTGVQTVLTEIRFTLGMVVHSTGERIFFLHNNSIIADKTMCLFVSIIILEVVLLL